MIPKIEFRYSGVYDNKFRSNPRIQKSLKQSKLKYLSPKEITKFSGEIAEEWKKIDKKILRELEKATGLKWQEKKIICYVIGAGIPFSDPLTVSIIRRKNLKETKEYFIDTLIHELIHQIYCQGENLQKADEAWNYFFRKYKKESHTTKIHIPLHAVYSHIYYKFFDEKRMMVDYNYMKEVPDYNKSWNIVLDEGYQNIIKEF
ncbi:MAG: hypothetical protein KC506_03300, partial [Nanoarchaeota archaeon]|nr:hypothetical protein [Nanoarchaeota archaeon]